MLCGLCVIVLSFCFLWINHLWSLEGSISCSGLWRFSERNKTFLLALLWMSLIVPLLIDWPRPFYMARLFLFLGCLDSNGADEWRGWRFKMIICWKHFDLAMKTCFNIAMSWCCYNCLFYLFNFSFIKFKFLLWVVWKFIQIWVSI